MELRIRATDARLKGAPAGDEQCDNCAYYLENSAEMHIRRSSCVEDVKDAPRAECAIVAGPGTRRARS